MKVLFLAAALAAGNAHAQQLGYKGVPLGGDAQQLLAQFPSIACEKPPPQFASLGDLHCTARLDCSDAACRASEKAVGTYAGMPAWELSFAVVGGRFEGFTAAFDSSSYEAIRDSLREAHGAGVESTMPMQTLGGARVSSKVWTYSTPTGSVTVFERARRIDGGAIIAETKALERWRRGGNAQRAPADI